MAVMMTTAGKETSQGLATMPDGAHIYYEDRGQGQPILFVHGWTCSSRFWRKNVDELAKEFRVVTLDLRGHGNSSKILGGHTIAQYARDVREIVERLQLEDLTLAGWSLGGPVVLSYYSQFSNDGKLKALGLIDTAPYPFSDAPWNSHGLKSHNHDALNAVFASYAADPLQYAAAFTGKMFKDGVAGEEDVRWISAELTKTPPSIAMAIYSDFAMSDHARLLPTLRLPVAVFAADSAIYPQGIMMGKSIAGQIPCASFYPFEDAGHLLFYEQPEKFNRALAAFVREVK
jgi:pimeloyl-ACP methyl ester carboxylesterase